MRLEFGGRLDAWLHPPDDFECPCGGEWDDEGCRNKECENYVPYTDDDWEEEE